MKQQINKLQDALNHFETSNPSISNRAVDWHIDHCIRIIVGVCSQLKKSDPETFKKTFNLKRALILKSGYIPRGKAKAPKHVNTLDIINKEEVVSLINKSKSSVQEIKGLPKKAFFSHPFFGDLNLKQTKRFLEVHTNHHLKIIDDIISSKKV
ncbi:DUF1569 domain-containing protein [Aurantibacter sp.]|uniref:DUF1569 domain-containing protein n=1 Tax=Aurantibacter sp. TaxID=2807103 RepID=UPI0035C79440